MKATTPTRVRTRLEVEWKKMSPATVDVDKALRLAASARKGDFTVIAK